VTLYEKLVIAMVDQKTDYISILITDERVEIYTSLEQEKMSDLLIELVMTQKELEIIH